MTKTEFFEIHGGGLVVAELDSTEYGDFLFLHPEEISKVQEFDTNEYQVVSVHETEDGEDIVDMGEVDYGNQPFKYGYFVFQRPL
jgi:hypothetical protein